MVALVDDQQIGRRQLHLVGADGARPQRLDRGDLHQLQRPRRDAGLDDAVRIPVACSLSLVCVMISRRCASTSTLRSPSTDRLMMARAITVLPEPVGATRMMRFLPAATVAVEVGDHVGLVGAQLHRRPPAGCGDAGGRRGRRCDGRMTLCAAHRWVGHEPVGFGGREQLALDHRRHRARPRRPADAARTLRGSARGCGCPAAWWPAP